MANDKNVQNGIRERMIKPQFKYPRLKILFEESVKEILKIPQSNGRFL